MKSDLPIGHLGLLLFPVLVAGWALTSAQDASDSKAALQFSGITLVSTTGSVDVFQPGTPGFAPPEKLPVQLGIGMKLRTGILSRALLEFEDGGVVNVAPHTQLKFSNPTCELSEGRLKAVAAPRQLIAVQTAAVPVRIRGRSFSVEMQGKGKGKMGALGNGRPTAAKLVAAKGFVEVQLPFGTVRPTELPLTLHEGSVVQTAANSFALIQFPDGSRLKLRADSMAAVDDEHRCTIAAGAADLQLSEKGKLEVRTANRPAWIRGPSFTVDVNPDKEAPQPSDDIELPKAEANASPPPGSSGWDSSGGR